MNYIFIFCALISLAACNIPKISTYNGNEEKLGFSEEDKEDLKHHRIIKLEIKGQQEELELLKQLSSKKISALTLNYHKPPNLDTSVLKYLNFTSPTHLNWNIEGNIKTDEVFDKALMERVNPKRLFMDYKFQNKHIIDLLIQKIPDYTALRTLWVNGIYPFPKEYPLQEKFEKLLDALLLDKKLERWRFSIEGLDSITYRIGGLQQLELLEIAHGAFESLPNSLGQLTKLTSLNIQRNINLTQLPESIGNLRKLDQLYLSENQLKGLPLSIGKLKRLHTLHLSNNKLQEIGAYIGELRKLEELRLDNNQLKTLPEEIKNLKRLHSLYLSGNPISKAEQEQIKSLLPNASIYF